MKVIIVGGGLSGLGTALALHKYAKPVYSGELEIKIFDNGINRNQGAVISLQRNAIDVLGRLDPSLRDRVLATSFPCKHFTFKTAGDFYLGRDYKEAFPVSRPLLLDCLRDALPKDIVLEEEVVSDVILEPGRRPVVRFANDSPEETADLVIGADGIHSPVRRSVLGEKDYQKYHPEYTGACAVGGILSGFPMPRHLLNDPSLIFIFGATGFFGYCGLSQAERDKLVYFSFYNTDLPARGQKPSPDTLNEELQKRYRDFADPTVRQCLAKADIDNVYPVFTMPKLNCWGRDGCLLIGDAAHALPPKTGQGGSQAFEDAETLALLLGKMLQREACDLSEAVAQTIQDFYELRHKRVEKLKEDADRIKDPKYPMSMLATMGFYVLMFVILRAQYIFAMLPRFIPDAVYDWDAKKEVDRYVTHLHAKQDAR